MQNSIEFKGLNELEAPEQEKVQTLATEHYDKIKRLFDNETFLHMHIKQYKKNAGSKSKYSIYLRAIGPTKMIFEAEKSDWDLARVIHKTFDALITEINHHFHKQSKVHKSSQ